MSELLKRALEMAEENPVLFQDMAIEAAAYGGFCKTPEAIEALEDQAFENGVASALEECKAGLYQNVGIYNTAQVRALMVKHGVTSMPTNFGVTS